MHRKKNRVWQSIVLFLFAIAVLFYVGYQAYRSIYSEVDTELVTVHSVFEVIETEGLVFRTETTVPDVKKGEPYYTIENGTRVAKGSVIASVYNDANSGLIEEQIAEIDEQIAAFKAIAADAGSGKLTLDVISAQTEAALLNLIYDTETGLIADNRVNSFDILSLLSKKALVTGKDVDFSAKIAELEQKRSELKSSYKAPISNIKAPVAGYFADQVDGFETVLTTDDVESLTTESLKEKMFAKPQANTGSCGKIVSGYEWYMACIVPDSYYNSLGVGRNMTIKMSFVLDEAIPVSVHAVNKDNKGNMVVVFRCDQMSAELSTIRREAVEIRLVEHTGLKVPQKAIVVNDEQQVGVYIRSGNAVAFRKIRQLYSEPADYAICEIVTDKDGYLRMYDDVIVAGRDLYDGKIIR